MRDASQAGQNKGEEHEGKGYAQREETGGHPVVYTVVVSPC